MMGLFRWSLIGVRDRLKLSAAADKLETLHGDAAVDVVDGRIRSARDRSERASLYRLRDEITRRRADRAACAAAAWA
jgi:hypothetical protein